MHWKTETDNDIKNTISHLTCGHRGILIETEKEVVESLITSLHNIKKSSRITDIDKIASRI